MMTPLALSLGTILGIHPTIRQDLTKLEISIFEQLTFLSYQAEQKGRTYITPGYESIAGVVGCCTKTVQRATEKFEALGLVRKQRRNPLGLGQWRSNLYQVNQAVRKWARKQYRRTFMSYKQSIDINYQLKESRMPLREDSLPLTKPGRAARKALLQLGQRASPPQTE
jgi:hypothetical protein